MRVEPIAARAVRFKRCRCGRAGGYGMPIQRTRDDSSRSAVFKYRKISSTRRQATCAHGKREPRRLVVYCAASGAGGGFATRTPYAWSSRVFK